MIRTSGNGFGPNRHTDEPPVVYTDDGGSGLLNACKARFSSPDYEVVCDARHTVWVRSAEGAHSVGLAPWLLRERPIVEVLGIAEAKLGLARAKT